MGLRLEQVQALQLNVVGCTSLQSTLHINIIKEVRSRVVYSTFQCISGSLGKWHMFINRLYLYNCVVDATGNITLEKKNKCLNLVKRATAFFFCLDQALLIYALNSVYSTIICT